MQSQSNDTHLTIKKKNVRPNPSSYIRFNNLIFQKNSPTRKMRIFLNYHLLIIFTTIIKNYYNMKKILTLLTLLLATFCLFAQADIVPVGGDVTTSNGSLS